MRGGKEFHVGFFHSSYKFQVIASETVSEMSNAEFISTRVKAFRFKHVYSKSILEI